MGCRESVVDPAAVAAGGGVRLAGSQHGPVASMGVVPPGGSSRRWWVFLVVVLAHPGDWGGALTSGVSGLVIFTLLWGLLGPRAFGTQRRRGVGEHADLPPS